MKTAEIYRIAYTLHTSSGKELVVDWCPWAGWSVIERGQHEHPVKCPDFISAHDYCYENYSIDLVTELPMLPPAALEPLPF